MTRAAAFLTFVCVMVAAEARADYSVSDKGTWPKSWPKELEPLRKQARSLRGSAADITLYEIPFARRDDFEAAWPHILKIKTPGAPVILVRSPDTWMGRIDAGVRIHCPPGQTGEPAQPGLPTPGATDINTRWLYTNYIELIVDGTIVDLNRIPLPPDLPIIDRRFHDRLTSWGMESGGLQAGLGYPQGKDRVYLPGETVTLVVRVRNVGKDEVKFPYLRQFFIETAPTVTDSEGNPVILENFPVAYGRHVPVEATLAPGKSIDLHELKLLPRPAREAGVAPSQKAGGDALVHRLWRSGKLSVQYERVFGNSSSGSFSPDPTFAKLDTGKLDLEIAPEPSESGKK